MKIREMEEDGVSLSRTIAISGQPTLGNWALKIRHVSELDPLWCSQPTFPSRVSWNTQVQVFMSMMLNSFQMRINGAPSFSKEEKRSAHGEK